MKILKPIFWGKKTGFVALLLLPISFFLQILISIKRKISIQHSCKIPVVCVGNIYVGGTGKTPLCILIAQELIKLGKKPAIIKKYYSEHNDEHSLINSRFENLFLNRSRTNAIINAEKKQHDIAILDDGFQDHSIKKNLNILCFNSRQLIGNGMTIPSGPLRENLNSLKRTKLILINGKRDESFEKKIKKISDKVKVFYSNYLPTNIDEFKGKKLFAFAGIGNPDNFFELLTENNLDVKKKLAFPDHYQFSKSEIQKMTDESFKNNLELITTVKDFFRINSYGFKNIKFIRVRLEIPEKNKLMNEILNCV